MPSKRNKSKKTELSPKLNLKIRSEFLEAHAYINGVKNRQGKTVIRPLNKEELEWIHKFECETVIFDFYHNDELRQARKKLRDKFKELADKLIGKELEELNKLLETRGKKDESLKRRISWRKYKLKKNTNLHKIREFIVRESKHPEIIALEDSLQAVKEVYNLYSDKENQRELYRINNVRNEDLYSLKNMSGQLINFDIDEYDRFTSEKLEGIDPEHLIINQISEED